MASSSLGPVDLPGVDPPRVDLLGWEWAPPPLPEPSPRRADEPQWSEPEATPRKGINDPILPAFLVLGSGGVVLLLAPWSAAWMVLGVAIIVLGGVLLQQAASDPVRHANVARAREASRAAHDREHGEWQRTVEQDEADEQRRFTEAARWYPIERVDPTRRIDVFGGGPEGWASFMYTAFVPLLAAGVPLTVLDLTNRQLARRALWAFAESGPAPLSVTLPQELHRYDPIVGVRHPGDLAALLVSAEGPTDDWARRDIEVGILRRTADVLGDNVTLPRLLAAVTAPLAPDARVVGEQLSAAERRVLLDPGFVGMLGGDAASHLGRVASVLEAVVRRAGGSAGTDAAAPGAVPFFRTDGSTVVDAAPLGNVDDRRRFDAVLAACLVDQIARSGPARGRPVLVVGADRLSRGILEGLTTAAGDAGLRLVLFFEHLRGEARDLVGRGAVETVVMRLGNHEDATAAASFIGKEHRFVVSSLSLAVGSQLGGSDNHGFSFSESESTTDQRSQSRTQQRLGPDSRTSGDSTSTSATRSISTSFSYSRSWSETTTYGETSTRSEEFVARAEDIQRLPATGFIYVAAAGGRQHVILGDCHPRIAAAPLVAPKAISRW